MFDYIDVDSGFLDLSLKYIIRVDEMAQSTLH